VDNNKLFIYKVNREKNRVIRSFIKGEPDSLNTLSTDGHFLRKTCVGTKEVIIVARRMVEANAKTLSLWDGITFIVRENAPDSVKKALKKELFDEGYYFYVIHSEWALLNITTFLTILAIPYNYFAPNSATKNHNVYRKRNYGRHNSFHSK